MSNETDNILFVLLKNRKFIYKVLAIVMALTIGITYIIPKKYTVTSVILPPEDQSASAASFGGLSLGEFAGVFSGGMGYSLPLMTTLGDVYVEILNSRTVIDKTILSTGFIDYLDLTDRYAREPEVAMFLARKTFNKNYSAAVTSSGFIQIDVSTKRPRYSVEVSERVIFLLDSINCDITLARFRENREVTENQLAVSQASLAIASDALARFEEDYGSVMPSAELEELMGVLAEMKGRYVEVALSLSSIRNGIRYGTTTQILELEARVTALKAAIETIENGSAVDGVEFGTGISALPLAVVEYAKLQTDFEMQLRMATALDLQVEQAIVSEQTIASSLRVLDPPQHPGWKSKPKRLYIWLEVFVIAFIFLAAFLYSRERWYRLQKENPEAWNKWNSLATDIRGDFHKKQKK